MKGWHARPREGVRFIGTGMPNPTPATPRVWCYTHFTFHEISEEAARYLRADPLTVTEPDSPPAVRFFDRADRYMRWFGRAVIVVAVVYLTAHVIARSVCGQ